MENPLSGMVLRGELKDGDVVKVDLGKDGLTFKKKPVKTAKAAKTAEETPEETAAV